MEVTSLAEFAKASRRGRSESMRLGIGLLFAVCVMLYAALTQGVHGPHATMLVAAAVIGGYMAMNIGANDVANNVGPAVGSRALSMAGALALAAVCEMAGALIAGGDVVSTIQKGIISADSVASPDRFVWLMTAALLAAALWLNVATALGAPVSTTHSIVGAVLGAGLAAGGMEAANWEQLGEIAASWLISPLLGGLFAAGFLYWIKRTITWRADMTTSAQRMVPVLIGLMVLAFTTYLAMKGLSKVVKIGLGSAAGVGAACGLLGWGTARFWVTSRLPSLDNTKESINTLFTLPLIFSAALLSFAHGANDVANAVGPLAAIADVARSGVVSGKAEIPLWVMMVGGIGIALGLLLYGPRLIRKVGSEITELDQMRAFCIAMSAAVTVIVASEMGLPVSSTHIAVGGVFGVGFLREYLKRRHAGALEFIKLHHAGEDKAVVEAFVDEFQKNSLEGKRIMRAQLKRQAAPAVLTKHERKQLRRVYGEQLVKRSEVLKIVAAWVVTVPATALMAALIFFTIFGMVHA